MATRELDRLFDTAQPSEEASPDRELTLSFQRGDRWAYDLIYRRYSTRVQGVCQRMLSDPHDAQDAAQETFLKVYQALPRFNGQYQLGAWITRIATNICLDRLRSRGRTPADAAPNDVLEDRAEAGAEATPEEALLRSVEGMRVHETLASLSPLHRRVITMRDLEGRDYRDIASSLGVPEARARVLLHRARKGFKKSWTSAGIFLGLPLRWLERVRRLRDPGVADPLINAAGSAGYATPTLAAHGPVAASCTQVLQHCGGVVSEKIAAAATAALVGVGVTATGGASVALSHEPREFLKPPVEASAQGIRDASEFAAQAAGSTVRQVTGVLKTTGVVDDATTGSLENVATAPAPAGPAASDDGSVPVADPAPGTASQEPSLSAPGVGPDPGSPVDPDVGDGAPQDTPAAVTNPAPPVDPAPSPTPSPQPSVPADGSFTVPLPETPAQDPGPPVDEGVSPSPSPAGGIAPGGGAGSQPSSSGSEPSTLESPAAGDALPGLSPSTEPSPTPVAGLGAVDDGMEVPGEGGLAG